MHLILIYTEKVYYKNTSSLFLFDHLFMRLFDLQNYPSLTYGLNYILFIHAINTVLKNIKYSKNPM